MSPAQPVYDRAPRPVQNAAVSLTGAALRWRRLGPGFRRALAAYESNTLSSAQTLAVRDRRLGALLDRWQGAEEHRRPAEERLGELPVTTKADLWTDPDRYRMEPAGRAIPASTGGSTGSPLQFRTTVSATREQWAVWWRYRRWHGIDLDTWCGQFNVRQICPEAESSRFWRYNLPGRQVQFSYRHLDADTVEDYLGEINRRRLRWLHGDPGSLALLATLISNAGLSVHPDLRWVTFGAENASDAATALVSSVFGAEVRDHYGLAEGVANLSECPSGRLHVDEDYSFVEFLPFDGGGEGTAGGPLHRIVGTAFTNDAQAFVRYDTGDLVSDIEGGCGCGRPGRTVGAVDGRTAGYAVLADGERIGPISRIFQDLIGVVQGQVFVTRGGGLVYHVIVDSRYTPSVAEEIKARTRKRSKRPISVEVEIRSALHRAANGKVPVVVQGDPAR